MTEAPSAARCFAMAAPMPLDAPVTTATLPESVFEFVFISFLHHFRCVRLLNGRVLKTCGDAITRLAPAKLDDGRKALSYQSRSSNSLLQWRFSSFAKPASASSTFSPSG